MVGVAPGRTNTFGGQTSTQTEVVLQAAWGNGLDELLCHLLREDDAGRWKGEENRGRCQTDKFDRFVGDVPSGKNTCLKG